MLKFKTSDKKIDLSKDKFYNKIIKLIINNNYHVEVMGSYTKYGKKKACDLDIIQKIKYNFKNFINNYIQHLIKLSHNNKIKITEIKFDIKDERIESTLKSIGYLDGNFIHKNYNINIDESLPNEIKIHIKELAKIFEHDKNFNNYLKLYFYLKDHLSPVWSIEDLKKREKIFNGRNIIIDELEFVNLSVDFIYNTFPINYKIYFNDRDKMKSNIIKWKLKSLITNDKINFYFVLKKFQTFLKWGYYKLGPKYRDPILAQHTVELYNNIYDFREQLGVENRKLCYYTSIAFITEDKTKLELINKKINKYFTKLNDVCKKYYLDISKDYKKYLAEHIQII